MAMMSILAPVVYIKSMQETDIHARVLYSADTDHVRNHVCKCLTSQSMIHYTYAYMYSTM